MRERVEMRVALHRHPGARGVVEAAEEILRAVPGIELVDLHRPAVGLQHNNLKVLPAYRRELDEAELRAAQAAGVDALVAVYHSDHRALCAHERDWPFANASRYHGKAPDEIFWAEPERQTRAVKEYLATLDAEAN